MSKCQHSNIDITVSVTINIIYHIRDSSNIEHEHKLGETPRQFDVHCHDCGLKKAYYYAPGKFGPQSEPRWLYRRVEAIMKHNTDKHL